MKRISQELHAVAAAAAAVDSAVSLSSTGLGNLLAGIDDPTGASCDDLRRRMAGLIIELRDLGDKSFEVNTFLLHNNHMAMLGNIGKFLDDDGSSSATVPGDQWCA